MVNYNQSQIRKDPAQKGFHPLGGNPLLGSVPTARLNSSIKGSGLWIS